MTKILREIIACILILIYYISRQKREGILSIYLHNPSKLLFEKIHKWLVDKGYKFISIEELENIINKKLITEKLVFISMDDGWRGNLDLIESMEKFKVPVTIFVPTQAVEEGNYWWEYARIKGQQKYSGVKKVEDFKKLPEEIFRDKIAILKNHYSLKRSCITLDELKRIGEHELITVGSHTVTHPVLNKCSIKTQTHELLESKGILSRWLNKDVKYLAYPNGDYDDNTIEIARKCGYKLCFTINPGKINVNNINPLLIPRNAMYDSAGIFENISKILGIWQKVLKRNRNNI
jgi:peptidoglycan/xylan/chitin deacetylase (PgdA/CDA1 family)